MDGNAEGTNARDPTARAELSIDCGAEATARAVWEAVRADDPGSVEGRVEGPVLVIRAGPASTPSLRATVDDVLACVQAAAGAVGPTAPPGGGRR